MVMMIKIMDIEMTTMTIMENNDCKMCSKAPEDPSAKPQVKANLGTLMGVYLPTIQVFNSFQ